MQPEFRLTESEMLTLHFAVKDLKKFKPVQYIVGEVPFMDLSIRVTPDVLIPRPETEYFVAWIHEQEGGKMLKMVDAGTGSGCIALAVKSKMPCCEVLGYDISIKALEVARANAKKNQLEVFFHTASIHDEKLNFVETIDILISNPPYVMESEKSLMMPNVLQYEPPGALFVSDQDPLLFYRALLAQAHQLLKPGGRVYFEINEQMGEEMRQLLGEYSYEAVELKSDLNNKPRYIKAIKT